jgi:hydrogenase nickel incorporation protein HypA/HybF
MHELSIASAVVATAERHAAGRRVCVVTVRVGRLRQVVPDSLEFYFGFAARDTACDGARLELEVLPAVLRCPDCAHEWELDEPPFRCPACGSGGAVVVGGEELEIESIELEEVEPCTVPV